MRKPSRTERFRSNIEAPDLEPHFRHATEKPDPSFGHVVLRDVEHTANCGYMTHDEAAILYALGVKKHGVWLEIGSHTGWTAAHLAVSGNSVECVDPEFKYALLDRFNENLEAAALATRVVPRAMTSDEFFELDSMKGRKFDGILIDGNHDAPCPLNDAKNAVNFIKEDGIIVFHDYVGQPIRDGVRWLESQGYKTRLYYTPQVLAVCWKGDFSPPDHEPDRKCVREVA